MLEPPSLRPALVVRRPIDPHPVIRLSFVPYLTDLISYLLPILCLTPTGQSGGVFAASSLPLLLRNTAPAAATTLGTSAQRQPCLALP